MRPRDYVGMFLLGMLVTVAIGSVLPEPEPQKVLVKTVDTTALEAAQKEAADLAAANKLKEEMLQASVTAFGNSEKKRAELAAELEHERKAAAVPIIKGSLDNLNSFTPPPGVIEEEKFTKPNYIQWVDGTQGQTFEDAKSIAKRLNRPIFIAFARTRCPYCEVVKEQVYQRDFVGRKLCGEFVPYWCFSTVSNGRTVMDHDKATADEFGIVRFPESAVYDPNTDRVVKFHPPADPSDFVTMLDDALERVNR